MSLKTGKKLGFFAALTMLIGSVVGIGIFFKSHGILRLNEQNGVGTLMSWLLGGLLALSAAVSFSEIGSMKTGKVSGVPAYAEQVGGKRFGYFARFNFSFFYMGVLSVSLGMFGSEILVGTFASFVGKGADVVPLWGHAIIALFITMFFLTLNILSVKASGIVAQVSTILKWIPLALVAILGIALATTNHNASNHVAQGSGYLFGHNAFTNGQAFTFTGMLAALPAVLFAYDSFLNVLSMKEKIEGGSEKLPKIVIVGMAAVIILYSLIAISAILHGSGMVSGAPFGLGPDGHRVNKVTTDMTGGYGIFDQVFTGDVAVGIGKFVIVFLAVSTLGVINGVNAAAVAVHEQSFSTNSVFGSKTIKSKFGEKLGLFIFIAAITIFWSIVEYVPMAIMKTDAFVDGASNFPTLFYFAIHAIVILLYTLKRSKLDSKKMNNIVYQAFAWIAIVGIIFVIGYQLVYGFFINAILHPAQTTHWGLYIGDNTGETIAFPKYELGGIMTLAQASIFMFSMLAVFVGFPFLNQILTKKFENNEVIINTQD